jgi:hypothetical protein
VAALIRKDTGADVEVIEGGRGEFTVWVGDELVAEKDEQGFPSDQDAAAAVQRALGAFN